MQANHQEDQSHPLITVRYWGTNCLHILSGKTSLLVDPHFTRPSKLSMLRRIAPDLKALRQMLDTAIKPKPEAILLTHTHYDHALDAVETARQSGALLLGSRSAALLGKSAGLPNSQVICVEPDQKMEFGDLTVTFLRSTHMRFPGAFADWLQLNERIETPLTPPAWFWEYRSDTVYALLLEHHHYRLVLQGSAGILPGDQLPIKADAVILSIGGLGIKTRAYQQTWFEQQVLLRGARKVYLSHWDDFTRPLHPHPTRLPGTRRVLRFLQQIAADRPEIHIELLKPGAEITL